MNIIFNNFLSLDIIDIKSTLLIRPIIIAAMSIRDKRDNSL
jgi:hypothetical protein